MAGCLGGHGRTQVVCRHLPCRLPCRPQLPTWTHTHPWAQMRWGLQAGETARHPAPPARRGDVAQAVKWSARPLIAVVVLGESTQPRLLRWEPREGLGGARTARLHGPGAGSPRDRVWAARQVGGWGLGASLTHPHTLSPDTVWAAASPALFGELGTC